MSVKTPVFGWDTPILGEIADVPADLLQLATEIENTLKVLEPKFLKTAGVGDAKKLLIVDGTGAAAFRAMSGDATISEAGAIAIVNEAITTLKILNLAVTEAKIAGEAVSTAKLANLGVTEGKLAALAVATGKIANLAVTEEKLGDKAVTSRKLKPTVGVLRGEGGEEVFNVAGVTVQLLAPVLKLTPAVTSLLVCNITAVVYSADPAFSGFRIGVRVSGTDYQTEAIKMNPTATGWKYITVPVVTGSFSAVEKEIQMSFQANTIGAGNEYKLLKGAWFMQYTLVGS